MRIATLFSGIGCPEYAASLLGWEHVFCAEIEPYCCRVLEARYGAPNLGDVRTANFGKFAGMVDILVGGFPCTDISKAGKGAGISGAKSSLWGEFARAIGDVRPRFVVVENASETPKRGLDRILCELADFGYDAEWANFRASDFGAWHQRARTFILAYPNGYRRAGILHFIQSVCPAVHVAPQLSALDGPSGYFEWFQQSYGEPAVWGNYDGLARRLHVRPRHTAIGNAIYWPILFTIFKGLEEAEALGDETWNRLCL